ATISCVNYDERFAFLGFYIVRPDLHGRGYGLRIWNAAIAHAPTRPIRLDAVVAHQANYRKSGLQLPYANAPHDGPHPPRPPRLRRRRPPWRAPAGGAPAARARSGRHRRRR